jgi:hypothetical protein
LRLFFPFSLTLQDTVAVCILMSGLQEASTETSIARASITMEIQQEPTAKPERKLLGFKGFVRHNPKSDRFVKDFHDFFKLFIDLRLFILIMLNFGAKML